MPQLCNAVSITLIGRQMWVNVWLFPHSNHFTVSLQVIWHQHLELRLKRKQEKLYRKCFWLWLARHYSVYRKLLSLIEYFACKRVKNQQIAHKMAQGSFASRIFHKYCKNSQEQKGPDSELPHISEFTTMWEKMSKYSVLPLHIKYSMSATLCSWWQSVSALGSTGQKINALLFLYLSGIF